MNRSEAKKEIAKAINVPEKLISSKEADLYLLGYYSGMTAGINRMADNIEKALKK